MSHARSHYAHACCHANHACSLGFGIPTLLRGRSGAQRCSEARSRGPARTAQPRPRPQRSSHPSYSHRTKRTITRAITRTDGAAPRPSERLVARGRSDEIWGGPPQIWGGPPQIWGGPHQIWGGQPQTGRARTQRYTAPRHPAYARASSGDQWQSVAIRCNQWQSSSDQWPSLAIPMQSVAISGPRRTCARLTASSPSYQCRPRPPASTRRIERM